MEPNERCLFNRFEMTQLYSTGDLTFFALHKHETVDFDGGLHTLRRKDEAALILKLLMDLPQSVDVFTKRSG